jgi:hypothetical protein
MNKMIVNGMKEALAITFICSLVLFSTASACVRPCVCPWCAVKAGKSVRATCSSARDGWKKAGPRSKSRNWFTPWNRGQGFIPQGDSRKQKSRLGVPISVFSISTFCFVFHFCFCLFAFFALIRFQ